LPPVVHRQECLRGRSGSTTSSWNGIPRLGSPWTVPHPPEPGHKPGSGVNNLQDPVETKLHTAVCNGKTTFAQAQHAIVTGWYTALARRFA